MLLNRSYGCAGRGEALANEILTGGGPSKRKAARETSKAASRPKVDARDDLRNPGTPSLRVTVLLGCFLCSVSLRPNFNARRHKKPAESVTAHLKTFHSGTKSNWKLITLAAGQETHRCHSCITEGISLAFYILLCVASEECMSSFSNAAGGEVETETDSDDEADYFGAAYEDALLAEMREHDIKHPASGPPTANGNAAGGYFFDSSQMCCSKWLSP